MFQLRSLRAAMLAAFALASPLAAQGTLTVPGGLLRPGDTIEVRYSNPSSPGKRVDIELDDGSFPVPATTTVSVTLDASGQGTVNVVVPNWLTVAFNAPDAQEVTRFTTPDPDGKPQDLPVGVPASH
jgi:hypothetical protein